MFTLIKVSPVCPVKTTFNSLLLDLVYKFGGGWVGQGHQIQVPVVEYRIGLPESGALHRMCPIMPIGLDTNTIDA